MIIEVKINSHSNNLSRKAGDYKYYYLLFLFIMVFCCLLFLWGNTPIPLLRRGGRRFPSKRGELIEQRREKTALAYGKKCKEECEVKEVRKVKNIYLTFLNNSVIEKLYELRRRGKRLSDLDYSHNDEDDEVLVINPNDYEERLDKGFKIFEMSQKGYPEDE